MNFWKVILATVVIFGTGVFTGGLLVNQVDHSRPKNQRHQDASNSATNVIGQQATKPPRLPEILSKQFLQRLDEELHLTQEQRDTIQKIVADGQKRNSDVWSNALPQIHQIMVEARQHIREQLTPEQQKQFEDLMKHAPHRQPSTNAPPVLVSVTNVPAN